MRYQISKTKKAYYTGKRLGNDALFRGKKKRFIELKKLKKKERESFIKGFNEGINP